MTIKTSSVDDGRTKAKADIAAERICLRCRSAFWSEGFGERICSRCKGTVAWRTGAPGGSGHRRRRAGGGLS